MKRLFFFFILIIIAVICGTITGGYIALVRGVPQLEEIKEYVPASGTAVYADDNTLIGEFKIEKSVHVSISDIPESVIRAIISVEDSRFWLHKGIDYIAIVRALSRDIIAGRIKEGASTITQQLAKVVFLSPDRTIARKLKEATLAYRIEKNLSKEQILELYLNKIYFGSGAYGIEMAARAYFGKSVSELSLPESAMLCGLVKAPSKYSPYINMDKAKERQWIVLSRMQQEKYINEAQATFAYEQPLYLSSVRYSEYSPNYFLEYIRKNLEDTYGVEMIYKGGLEVHTTFNNDIQRAAVDSLQQGLRNLDKRQGYRGPVGHKDINVDQEMKGKEIFEKVVFNPGDLLTATVLKVYESSATVKARGFIGKIFVKDSTWIRKVIDEKGNVIHKHASASFKRLLKPGDQVHVRVTKISKGKPVLILDQEPLVQGAVVAMEPSTGYVRAIVGGYDFSKSEFNRAVYAKRQAGSAFKPVIYAAAMDHNYTPASLILDEPIMYESEEFGNWSPENYDEKYHGATRLREALVHSRNIVTVRLLEDIGVGNAVRFARNLGFKGPFPLNLTFALGSLSITPLEITSAFCVFANSGRKPEPITIKYIVDADGDILESNTPGSSRVIDPQTAYLTTSMLEDVVKKGTGWRAKALKRSVAGKTGTTNDYRDAWFIGYTPELATSVWVGFDNVRTLGDEETGSRAAAPIWVSFMKKALAEIAPFDNRRSDGKKPFPIPDGIVTGVIDPETGLLATNQTKKMLEFFKEGTVPTLYSSPFYRDLVRRQKIEMQSIIKDEEGEEKTLSN